MDRRRLRFYKIMVGDFAQLMSIPAKLMKHFEGQLSNVVALKGPSGKICHVGLTKTTTDSFLQAGWKEFVEAHHIQENDLLLFEYYGSSCFDVVVFDGNGCEKAFLFSAENHTFLKHERTEDSVDLNTAPHRRVFYSNAEAPPVLVPHEFPRAQPEIMSAKCRQDAGTSKGVKHRTKQGPSQMHEHSKPTQAAYCISRKRPLTDLEQKKAHQLTLAVKPGNPFFIAVMQPRNVSKCFFLTVPSKFAIAHLPCNQSIVLQTAGQDRAWAVSYIVMPSYSGISKQWKRFALDNNLAEGDVLLFELIDKKRDTVMTVHIFRAVDKIST